MDLQALEFVGVAEMFEVLVTKGLSEREAARTLGRAIQSRQIALADKYGRMLSDADRDFIAELVFDLPSSLISSRPNTRRDQGWGRVKADEIGGMRMLFEQACGIRSAEHLAVGSAKGVQTNREAELKAKCVEWIRQLPVKPRPKRDQLKGRAMKEIRGLSGHQFKAAWDEAAPAEWKRAGAPRK
jgi:hypothetical protein